MDVEASTALVTELRQRQASLLDSARHVAVARRRKTRQRTARENIFDLVDRDSFVEYGGLALAAQRSTRSLEQLVALSPADGLVSFNSPSCLPQVHYTDIRRWEA